MKIVWQIEAEDIKRVHLFFNIHRNNPFVRKRIERNLERSEIKISKDEFFKGMVSCLITTQQRSGPDSVVTKFINTNPFPLNYQICISQSNDLHNFIQNILGTFGLRRWKRISDEIVFNLERLEKNLWGKTFKMIEELQLLQSLKIERVAAEFIDTNFKGFGPKQSRNLLQSLGLTKYEIPIDSRIVKWLNNFGFPIKLSANALSDSNYYNFISDGIQEISNASGITPCVLDAAIFVSFDSGSWTEKNVVW